MSRLLAKKKTGGAYFRSPESPVLFSCGCALLDCALGGGYARGRIVNIVGDKSTGKTLLAIEACANFAVEFPDGRIRYAEAEAAFDKPYAGALGLPLDRVTFADKFDTVEEFFVDLQATIEKWKGKPGLYILDSLDALSDKAEMERGIDEGTYGAAKAKQMSQVFRRIVRQLEESKTCLIIISQVREAIGVTFGRKTSRSGGKALDFYASQVIYLAQIGMLHKTIAKQKRAIGVEIKAKIDKNKIGMPFRECQFTIRFGFGVDDLLASVEWLEDLGKLSLIDADSSKAYIKQSRSLSDGDYRAIVKKVRKIVIEQWREIEASFKPERRKYA